MNSEFAWSVMVIFLAFILGAIALGLYWYWKNNKDYKENHQIIVWIFAITAGVTLIFGILMMIWASHKKNTTNLERRIIAQNNG